LKKASENIKNNFWSLVIGIINTERILRERGKVLGRFFMTNKGKIILSIVSAFLFMNNLNAETQILEQKIVTNQATDCDMHWAEIIFNDDDEVLVSTKGLLYINNNLIKIGNLSEYCCDPLGGFVKDNQFCIAFQDADIINIYSVKEKTEIISQVKPIEFSRRPYYDKVITIPVQDSSYYLLGHYTIFPSNPIEHIRTLASAGEGVYYEKQLLAEIQDNKIVRYIKLDYGGKTDESYVVDEVVAGKDSIHLLGFRNIDVPFVGKHGPTRLVRSDADGYGLKRYYFERGDYYDGRDISPLSVILYYSDYNLEREKNTRKHKIYENIPGYDKKTDTYSDYGVLSADSQDDNVFVVFSWVQQQKRRKEGFNIENIKSDIYFWQCSDKSYGKAEKITEGFCPLVRVDQFGIVHVFWLDRDENVVHKTKKDDKWSNEEIILSGVNAKSIIYTKRCSSIRDKNVLPGAILYTKFFTAEFDKNNNLHAVYPTAEGIVYTKLKLE
jgi:hypothetical protein